MKITKNGDGATIELSRVDLEKFHDFRYRASKKYNELEEMNADISYSDAIRFIIECITELNISKEFFEKRESEFGPFDEETSNHILEKLNKIASNFDDLFNLCDEIGER